MLFEVVLENNSVDKKDFFQQKVIKVEAADKGNARIQAENEAKKLGSTWRTLYINPFNGRVKQDDWQHKG